MLRLAAIATTVLAVFAAPAAATTFSAEQGAVKATITYTKSSTQRLTITRNGATLFDAAPVLDECDGNPCAPSGFSNDPPVRVMDLDGNGEPEVIYSAYTGGAHCCSIAQVYALNAAANGYDTSARDFFDPGFDVKDIDGDGKREFVTRDAVFAYRFTAYAFSGFPVQLLHWSAGTFTDVTNSFPGTINADVKVWFKRYTRARKRRDGTELGPVSAWAADMYRLGKRKHVLKVLRSEARHGYLKGPGRTHGARFVKVLDRFLRKHGY